MSGAGGAASDTPVEARKCPVCGGDVSWMFACHTYEANGRWMACLPCDSATNWYCVEGDDDEGCGWEWTQGLNPRNPRAADNDTRRPAWASYWNKPA